MSEGGCSVHSQGDSDESSLLALTKDSVVKQPFLRRRTIAVMVVLLVALTAIFASVAVWRQGTKSQAFHTDHLDSQTSLTSSKFIGSLFDVLREVGHGFRDAEELSETAGHSYGDLHRVIHEFKGDAEELEHFGFELIHELGKPARFSARLKAKLHSLNATQKKQLREQLLRELNITSLADLRPHEDLHDGNRCADDEEEHAGLCYKQCSLLTSGQYPNRITAWECCEHEPPCLNRAKTNIELCGGYGVSGDSMGNGCPHSPGGCLMDEELNGNMCYMRCSLLTYGMLKYRNTPDTCCKTASPFAVLELGVCDTDVAYDVGGGLGGGEGVGDTSMPNAPHPPMTPLTEV